MDSLNHFSSTFQLERSQKLYNIFKKKIVVLDGGMGTQIQSLNLTAEDFGGEAYEGCNEYLNLTKPEAILTIHQRYINAGADIIETNTFGATPLVLDEYQLGHQCYEINKRAAEIARQALTRSDQFVAGSIGPTTKAISVTGGITFDELIFNFAEQIKGLIDGGVDYLLIETAQDTRNVKAALLACDQVFAQKSISLPIAVSGTIEPMGTMLGGQTAEALTVSLLHRPLLYLGLNCATGPLMMLDHFRALQELAPWPLACVPNAGLPNEFGQYLETPQIFSQNVQKLLDLGLLNLVGGCCGTTPEHIRALSEVSRSYSPREWLNAKLAQQQTWISGMDALCITDEIRPVLVGERTNSIGSRKFKKLIEAGQFLEATEIAKTQVRNGAQVIDICLANPDRDELSDITSFLERASQSIQAPLMLDSTDVKVFEKALTYSQGKAILNSINLEDGEERFEKVLPLVKKFGASVVVGTIDEDPAQGMGVSLERKLEIARRSYDLLTQKYQLSPTDIIWDPLVFPCASGDQQYHGSATATVQAIRELKKLYPLTKTILGISNVSFGLPPEGREALNSVFLYHCTQAGLDFAIVNTEKLVRYAEISTEQQQLCERLLFPQTTDPEASQALITDFANHFRTLKTSTKKEEPWAHLSTDEQLARSVIEGTRHRLFDNLELKLKTQSALQIINGPLMKGMDEVGRLFNQNKLIVAEVLQSAEVMKAAVQFLEPFIEKNSTSTRGKVLLATVKGDVHDIGKNLVDIIFSNNGFQVINLGIKIPPAQLIEAIHQHQPDIIGLSGLLVKSAHQMVTTAQDLSRLENPPPMLVGGAALSQAFVDLQIAPAYKNFVTHAKDAMTGLSLAKSITQPDTFETLQTETFLRRSKALSETPASSALKNDSTDDFSTKNRSDIKPLLEIPQAPHYERVIEESRSPRELFSYINPLMLYGRHLGMKGAIVKKLQTNPEEVKTTDPKSYQIWSVMEELKRQYADSVFLKPRAVYQYFRAKPDHDRGTLNLYTPKGDELLTSFTFPRQSQSPFLSLLDYVAPELPDHITLFVVTVGKGVRQEAERLKEAGEFLKCHALQALAIETAEAYAEFLHAEIRKQWGYPDPATMTSMERFQAKYRGKRYSFGYPACPDLEQQAALFKLLQPQVIGVELTDGMMMDPEASVSAIVFHHPDASYFSVGPSRQT